MFESLAQRLRLSRAPTSIAVFGVGGKEMGSARGLLNFSISPWKGGFVIAVFGTDLSSDHLIQWRHSSGPTTVKVSGRFEIGRFRILSGGPCELPIWGRRLCNHPPTRAEAKWSARTNRSANDVGLDSIRSRRRVLDKRNSAHQRLLVSHEKGILRPGAAVLTTGEGERHPSSYFS